MGRTHSTHKRHVPGTRPKFCDGRDMRSGLSFWEVELLCMQNSTSSLPFCAHSPKNTARPISMRNTILSRFCIPNPALRAFAAVLQRDEGGFEFVASLLVRLQCCRCWVLRAGKYRNMFDHVSSCCPGRTASPRRLCDVLLFMPTSSPLGLPLAQSSTCRHAITASDLVGPHEYADDVAPAEERSRSSQSHTCENQPPELSASPTHSQRIPAVYPQFGSDASLLRGGETARRSLEDCAALARPASVPLLTGDLQRAQKAQGPQNWPAVCQRHA